ncbi:MAG: sensor histidine kinase [Hyphomicrobiales bacterium]
MVNIIALIITAIFQIAAFILTLSLSIKLESWKYKLPMFMTTIGVFLLLIRRTLEFWSLNTYIYSEGMATFLGYVDIFIPIFLSFSLIFLIKLNRMIQLLESMKFRSEQKLLTAIIRTEEKEREILAKEVHDNIGPMLSSIKMNLSAIKHSEKEISLDYIKSSLNIIDQTLYSLRKVSNDITLHVLKTFGLEKAISNYINKSEIPENTDILLNVNIDDKRYQFSVEVILYRVIISMIRDCISHEQTTRVNIDIFEINEIIFLHFKSNSNEFKPTFLAKNPKSEAVSNIALRIKSIKGIINVIRNKSKGTQVNIKINNKLLID